NGSSRVTLGNLLIVGGPTTIDDTGNFTFTGKGILTSGNMLKITTKSPNTTAFTNVLSGPGSLAKYGLGNLVLTASNTYTGTTTVGTSSSANDNGVLQLG